MADEERGDVIEARARHVTTQGFEREGVRLISPSDGEFDRLVGALAAPGWAQAIFEAAPSIVIVANESAMKIVAMSTRFDVTGGRRPGRHSVFFVAPDAIATTDLDYGRANSKGILPGQQRLIGFNFSVPDRRYYSGLTQEEADCYDPQTRDWIQDVARDLASARAVHVTFDAVIFHDGRLLGDHATRLSTHFGALVEARQRVYRSVLRSLESGRHGDDVVRELWPAAEPDDVMPSTDSHAADDARNTTADLLQNYGAVALADVLRRAILPQPFVIHRDVGV